MIQQYKHVYFNGQELKEIYNATTDNEMYSSMIGGNRTIVEEKVPGRDVPHMFWIDREPLSFSLTFAFKKPMHLNEIKNYVRMFLNQKDYVDLQLVDESNNSTPVFSVIVTESPQIDYTYRGDNKYLGVFTINFRCNAPYGFQRGEVNFEDSNTVILSDVMSDEDSDKCVIIITNNNNTEITDFFMAVYTDQENTDVAASSYIGFTKIYPLETVIINQLTKRITSNHIIDAEHPHIYERWNTRSFINITTDYNKIVRSFGVSAGALIENVETRIEYELPRYI